MIKSLKISSFKFVLLNHIYNFNNSVNLKILNKNITKNFKKKWRWKQFKKMFHYQKRYFQIFRLIISTPPSKIIK